MVLFLCCILMVIITTSMSHNVYVDESNTLDLTLKDQHVFVLKGLADGMGDIDDLNKIGEIFGKRITDTASIPNSVWYSDMSYSITSPSFSIMGALPSHETLPMSTLFKDMTMVLEDFPKKERLIGMVANHTDHKTKWSLHPVVKGNVLFVNRYFTHNIIDDNDNKLLTELLSFIDNHKESEILIEWEINDILLWNSNHLSTMSTMSNVQKVTII